MPSAVLDALQRTIHKEKSKAKVPGLIEFCEKYLDMRTVPHQRQWFRDIVQFLKEDRYFQLWLAPRGSRKTTSICYVLPLWLILKNPNVRILILGKNSFQASKTLIMIKNELETNERIRADFGELKGDKWTDKALTVKRLDNKRDPTITADGIDGATTGGHFDYIILDDIIDTDNSRTDTMKEYIRDYFYGTVKPMRDSHTKVFVVGTRKAPFDIYDTMIKDPVFDVRIFTAITKMPDNWINRFEYVYGEDQKLIDVNIYDESEWDVLFPEEWPIKRLLEDRLSDPVTFDRERMNDIAGMVGNFLKYDWLKFYLPYKEGDAETAPPENKLIIFHGVDPAIAESETADYFGFARVGVNPLNGLIYVLSLHHERLDFASQIEFITRFGNADAPMAIAIETDGYQAVLKQRLMDLTVLPVIEAPSKGKDKATRMYALQPNLINGRVLFPGQRLPNGEITYHDNISEFLKQEYLAFPNSEHDDRLDALEKAIGAALQYMSVEGSYDWEALAGHRTFNTRTVRDLSLEQDDGSIDYPLVALSQTYKEIDAPFMADEIWTANY